MGFPYVFFSFLFLVPVTRVSWKRKSSGLQVVCGFISVALLGMPIPIEIEIEEKEKLPISSFILYQVPFLHK